MSNSLVCPHSERCTDKGQTHTHTQNESTRLTEQNETAGNFYSFNLGR